MESKQEIALETVAALTAELDTEIRVIIDLEITTIAD
jgi:hypothetical protein